MDRSCLPVILLALMAATVFTLETSQQQSRPEELHTRAATYSSNRRQIPRQQIVQSNNTVDRGKESRTTYLRRATQYFGSRINNNKINLSSSKNAASIIDPNKSIETTEDEKINEESLQRPTSEGDTMMMAGAGHRKNSKSKRGDDDDDDEKTLSQQIADGKYGLIEKEIYATTPKRPGIVSYASNPEVPRDNAKNLGGLDPEEIWLAENHVLVLRGGFFPEHKFNRTDDTATAWPPIDNFNAPPRQVKIPANPKVPPPFPVQLTDDGPTQFIGFNGTQGRPPFPPFFPQPPPGNGSYFAPPFPFAPPGNFTQGFYPPIPPGNFTPGGGIYPPPGNGSFYPPPFPFPLPPPRNGSYFAPPPGNFTPGSGPFYPPPFPGFPFPPPNGTFRPLPPGIFPPNGTLPFPPNFFQNLPPGAAFLPPPGNLTEPFDEDDPSLYYPPPYDFYYPQDNSTEVPPGPLVPGIVLPPPPNFFAPLNNKTDEQTTKHPRLPTTTQEPPTRGSPHRTYLPANRQQVAKGRRPSISYLPVTNDLRKKKPRPSISTPDNDDINHVTPKPEVYVLTTPVPEKSYDVEYNNKPPRPLINIVPQNVQVTHQGSSRIEPSPPKTYYYDEPAYVITRPPETIYINNGYSKVISDIVTTPFPGVTYYTAPVTDIEDQSISKHQQTGNNSQPNTSSSPAKELHTYEFSKEPNISQKQNSKQINTPTTTLTPLLIFYTPRQQDIETNRVTPPSEPYYVKAQGGVTATLPPVLYYTVPSAGKTKESTSVKTSFYFYEEPREEQVRHDSLITTQIPPSTFEKPITGHQYNSDGPPIPPLRGRGGSKKMLPQYTLSKDLPLSNAKEENHKEEPQSEAPPTETPIKTVTQDIRPQIYTTSGKVSARPQQYIYSDVVPVGQVNSARQRTQGQPYILSPILPVGQQAVYPSRSKLPYASTPSPPQYYYVTASPRLQYNIVGSSTPSVINQQYPSQLSQQGYAKSTPQPSPIISNLAYFSTPRPEIVFQDVVSSERPILYNIQPSPRPIYQYSFESNKNTVTQQPLRQTAYTTPRPKTRPVQKINYSGNSQGPVLLPVQYQTTPRTLFEYSYQQQGLSTAAPEIQGYYSAVGDQYDEPEDVTAGSPTTHYGYDSREQNQQSQSYQSTPRPKYNRYQNPSVPQVNIYPTANPLHAYFTRQDETLLDDITKKYFTIFGQKLQGGEENGPTTPISSYANRNEQQPKQTNTVNRDGQHYTTPAPNYNYHTAERPSGSDNRGPIPLADDINVNYKKPLPPINPYSEFVDTRQVNSEPGGALVSYRFPGDGGHFYFITPQVVGAQPQQTANGYLYSLQGQPTRQLGVTYRRKKRKDQR